MCSAPLGEAMQEANLRLTAYGYASLQEINEGGCFEWATEVFALVQHAKIVGKWHSGGYHAFIQFRKKYYDSETPQGVKDWRRLPYFKRCA